MGPPGLCRKEGELSGRSVTNRSPFGKGLLLKVNNESAQKSKGYQHNPLCFQTKKSDQKNHHVLQCTLREVGRKSNSMKCKAVPNK